MEVESEADRGAVKLGQQRFVARHRPESLPDEIGLARLHLIGEPFEFRKLPDQPQQRAASSAFAARIRALLIEWHELIVEQLAPPVFERHFACDLG
jgi:hypothetical protein